MENIKPVSISENLIAKQDHAAEASRPVAPPSYLVWALVSLSFCLPFGLVALVNALKVDSQFAAGDMEGALQASRGARKWCLATLYFWIAVVVLYVLLLICIIAFS